jgi:hypothetical protein
MTHPTQPISPLCERMIDDMALRKLKPRTQNTHIRAVSAHARKKERGFDTSRANWASHACGTGRLPQQPVAP